ncbi:MAG TPA: hypothetical protein VIR33_15120 [Thermopolyspora sp.]
MGERALSRRVLLRGSATTMVVATTAGCAQHPAARKTPSASRPPDPETVLLRELIAGKEQVIELYRQAALSMPGLAPALRPFELRHLAHLAELRRRLPPHAPSATAGPPTPGIATPGASATATPGSEVGLSRLRSAERKAAASRAGQLARVSPPLAQLLACIGACEAGHVIALAELRRETR